MFYTHKRRLKNLLIIIWKNIKHFLEGYLKIANQGLNLYITIIIQIISV